MFVYSMRASTLKFFSVIALALITLSSLIIFIPSAQSTETAAIVKRKENINYDKIKDNSSRIKFLEQFGWTVEEEPCEEAEITIPDEFDKIMNSYNELQKRQGLNLTKYKKKTLTRYTYKITNYPNYSGTVYANIILYKNRVVAGDICSADVNGFIHDFSMPQTNE